MKCSGAVRSLVAVALCWLSAPLLAAIGLVPVVSSGLSSPLFAGHAGDGSNRLFIEEQVGVITVLQPGASTPRRGNGWTEKNATFPPNLPTT